MLFFCYHDNIASAYPALTSTSDSLYLGGRASFLAANVFTLIGLGVEMIILFFGVNMFKERLSFVMATVHLVGCILYVSFGFWQWQFDSIWALWAVFSLLPLTIEIIAACHPDNK
jgi:hypothetical protein